MFCIFIFAVLFPGNYCINQQSKRLLLTDQGYADNQQIHKDIQTLKATLAQLTQESNSQNNVIQQLTQQSINHSQVIQQQETTIGHLQDKLRSQANDIQKLTSAPTGSAYIRWGRKTCNGSDTDLVYSGIAGGGNYGDPGRSAEPVCLPHDPDLGPIPTNGNVGAIYGMEYKEANLFGKDFVHKDVPCAVCRANHVTSVLTIPGKLTCSKGWKEEYRGKLASGYWNHNAASSNICVDMYPEVLEGGLESQNGYIIFPVIAKCGSLKCPPYQPDRMFTCVVCSK